MLAINVKKMEELSGAMARFQMDLEEVMYRLWTLHSEMADDVMLASCAEGAALLEEVDRCSQKLQRVCRIGEALCGILPEVQDSYTKGVKTGE